MMGNIEIYIFFSSDGRGPVNPNGLDYYNNLINGLYKQWLAKYI
jgi:hypothetical protein